ncbi:MAG TPA: GNAT family N-acetyltransferase [Rhodothermales bacterium]|nr:GNAT family N-acetyltransferase [Rhodothermales bacterium]
MADFTILPAKREHRDEIERLWRSLMRLHQSLDPRFRLAPDASERWRNSFSDWLYETDHKMWVAIEEKRIVGYIAAHYAVTSAIFEPPGEVFIQEIYVETAFRGLGIGKVLVGHVKEWALKIGSKRIGLIASSRNVEAQSFWERQNAVEFAIQSVIEL